MSILGGSTDKCYIIYMFSVVYEDIMNRYVLLPQNEPFLSAYTAGPLNVKRHFAPVCFYSSPRWTNVCLMANSAVSDDDVFVLLATVAALYCNSQPHR